MRTPPTTARLLAKLENGAESDAFEAAKLLSNAKGVKLIASLSRILRSGVRPYSREAAAYALSWHKDRKAAEPLLYLDLEVAVFRALDARRYLFVCFACFAATFPAQWQRRPARRVASGLGGDF